MRRSLSAALCCSLVLLGCPKTEAPAPTDEAKLLAEVKTGLAERDRKLQTYELHGTTTEQGQGAVFRFYYRAPNRMRGVIEKPVAREFSFDGQVLYELDWSENKLAVMTFEVPDAQAKGFLTQLFGAFAPEGYRVPLLLPTVASAKRTSHPRAPDAVEVRQETSDDTGQKIAMTYVFRYPAMDFLEKRAEVAGRTGGAVVVEDEHCDVALKLCVPKRVVQGAAVTQLDEVKLNPILPQDSFVLVPPKGFSVEQRTLGGKK